MSSEEVQKTDECPVDLKPVRRRGRGPGPNKPPKHAPRSVSEIFHAAACEERETATKQAVELLSYWRGLSGSRDVAERLGVKQNHVYQLQQRALAGMVAGLLPRSRKNQASEGELKSPKLELESVQKELEKTRKERDAFAGLVRLLRNLPGAPKFPEAPRHGAGATKQTRGRRDAASGRRVDAQGKAHTKRTEGNG